MVGKQRGICRTLFPGQVELICNFTRFFLDSSPLRLFVRIGTEFELLYSVSQPLPLSSLGPFLCSNASSSSSTSSTDDLVPPVHNGFVLLCMILYISSSFECRLGRARLVPFQPQPLTRPFFDLPRPERSFAHDTRRKMSSGDVSDRKRAAREMLATIQPPLPPTPVDHGQPFASAVRSRQARCLRPTSPSSSSQNPQEGLGRNACRRRRSAPVQCRDLEGTSQ